MYHDQNGQFTPEMQDFFEIWKSINITHHTNRLKAKTKTKDNLNRCRKRFSQNPVLIHDKNSQQLGMVDNFLKLINKSYKQPTA